MDSMVNIGREKLVWVTTSGLLQGKTLFRMKYGDSSSADTSCRGNRANRITSIKLIEDSIVLSSIERSHGGNG